MMTEKQQQQYNKMLHKRMESKEFIEKHIETNCGNYTEKELTVLRTSFDLGIAFCEQTEIRELKQQLVQCRADKATKTMQVDSLYAELAALRKENEWVDVKVRLPGETNIEVLICTKSKSIYTAFYKHSGLFEVDSALNLEIVVTHWRPLPSIEHLK